MTQTLKRKQRLLLKIRDSLLNEHAKRCLFLKLDGMFR